MLKDAREGRCYRDFPVLRRLFLLAAFAALASAGWASSLLASRAAHAAKIPDDATATTATAATTTTAPAPAPTTTQVAATSTAAATLVVTGHGWGHGIGMSQ